MTRLLLTFAIVSSLRAQTPSVAGSQAPAAITAPSRSTDQVLKKIDDLEWRLKISDVADFDKVAYTSLPPVHNPNPTGPGAGNPLIVYASTTFSF